jgi:hypothetical protein
VRQRLSSEPDRYRGRRRVPTPPRSRYAVVVTSAFVGAGVVALGAASQLPDAKTINPSVLQNLEAGDALADRSADGDRASRGEDRTASTKISDEQAEAQAWLLPLEDYQFTSPYGVRFGKLHAGIDLASPEGTGSRPGPSAAEPARGGNLPLRHLSSPAAETPASCYLSPRPSHTVAGGHPFPAAPPEVGHRPDVRMAGQISRRSLDRDSFPSRVTNVAC